MSNDSTPLASSTDGFSTEPTEPLTSTSPPYKGNGHGGDGMSGGAMAGMVIGITAGVVIIAFVAFFVINKYRKIQRDKTTVYKQKVNELNIDKLPSPSEIERVEIRQPDLNKDVKTDSLIEQDLESSDYVNAPKYENVDKSEKKQPIYLEPKQGGTLNYTAANVLHGEMEYYVVENPGKSPPSLPNRDDSVDSNKKQEQTSSNVKQTINTQAKIGKGPPKPKTAKGKSDDKVAKSVVSSSSKSDSDSDGPNHSTKDYVNIKEQKFTPPPGKDRRPKTTQPQALTVQQDDVYENEEIPKSPRSKTTKR